MQKCGEPNYPFLTCSAGPAGQDGEDGTVDTDMFYNKAQVDFLLATNTPNIGTYPGGGHKGVG